MSTRLKIQLLGDFRLIDGDAPVTAINTPRLQALLAYLVLHRNAPQIVPTNGLSVLARFHGCPGTHQFAQCVTPTAQHLARCRTILTHRRGSLQWRPDVPYTLDIADFDRICKQRRKPAIQSFNARHWKAPFSAIRVIYCLGATRIWILPEREQWQRAFTNVLEQLIFCWKTNVSILARSIIPNACCNTIHCARPPMVS